MLCRNRVDNYEKWKAVFDKNNDAGQAAGLTVLNMWRDLDEPNNVFFLLSVESVDKAREFISHPDAAKSGEISGVIDGECNFVQNVPGY
jgi:hypothetical protein